MATGHWLDGLWKRLIIAWNGNEMPERGKIEFSSDFILDDSDADGGKTTVHLSEGGGGGGPGILGGDVTGLSDGNRIERVTGGTSGTVGVIAEAFLWDPDTSAGEAELTISGSPPDAGALTMRHDGKEVLAAVATAPRLGNATSIARLLGGMRFTRRTVNSNVTLDTTTTDMLVHVNAAGERSIRLPPPSDGRTILFMIAGPSVVTIQRNASEQINGVAGNYIVPFANAMVIVSSDGANWLARSYGDATPITLVGDANGTPDDNTIQRITGDLAGGVAVGANSLLWDLAVSSGGAEVKVSAPDAGALSLRHSGADVVVAAAAGARVGTAAGSNRLIGATRLTRRTVNTASVFLDSVTTDTLVHVDASAPRAITLPAPTDGRTIVFMILGSAAVTIRRSSLESINGVAGDYVVPQPNAMVVATSDGTNWIARSFGDAPAAVTLNVTAPITGGGQLNANRTIGFDGSGFVGVARLVNTTAPLTGGGALNADLTLAVSGATAAALGVVQLTGNLAGTAAAPLVTGLRADSISVQNTDGTHKGLWSTVGLRLGDNTAPTARLDLVGSGVASGDFIANNGAGGKARLAGYVGGLTTHGALYLGNVAPSATNYSVMGNGGTQTNVNAGPGGTVTIVVNGSTKASFSDTGVNNVGTFTQNTQYNGGQLWSTKTVSADYTIDTSTKDCVLFVDATSGPITVTLPAVGNGRLVLIKRKAGTNSITVMVPPLLDGQNKNITLQTDAGGSGIHPYVEVTSDGTDWFITRHFSIALSS